MSPPNHHHDPARAAAAGDTTGENTLSLSTGGRAGAEPSAMSPTRRRGLDLALLAAGGHTGWWDEHGRRPPWPRTSPTPTPLGGPRPTPRAGSPPANRPSDPADTEGPIVPLPGT